MELNGDELPDAVLRVDRSGRLAAANDRALALLGGALADAAGKPLADVLAASDPAGGPLDLDELGDGREQEVSFQRSDGTDVAAAVTARRTIDGVVLALRPLRRTGVTAVISTVGHELRSPLTSVKGYVSIVLNRWDRLGDAEKRTMLEQVHRDADRIVRLIDELLDVGRLGAGRLEVHPVEVDPAALARSVVDEVRMSIPELGCEVAVPEELVGVPADPDKLRQILVNLVENAAKYGSPTGIRITAGLHGAHWWMAVSDAGEGIPADELDSVFTMFSRRDRGRPSGTGLGLWICRGLAEAHGGTLTARSTHGQGSTFELRLPTAPPTSAGRNGLARSSGFGQGDRP